MAVGIHDLPHLNAALNGISTVLIVAAFVQIRRQNWRAHAGLMIAATFTSALFLASYLLYHHHVGEQSTAHMTWLPRWLRLTYLLILVPHIILAMVMLPMIAMTLWRAGRGKWTAHRRIGYASFLVWVYVSATGVIIYWMLYHLFPAIRG